MSVWGLSPRLSWRNFRKNERIGKNSWNDELPKSARAFVYQHNNKYLVKGFCSPSYFWPIHITHWTFWPNYWKTWNCCRIKYRLAAKPTRINYEMSNFIWVLDCKLLYFHFTISQWIMPVLAYRRQSHWGKKQTGQFLRTFRRGHHFSLFSPAKPVTNPLDLCLRWKPQQQSHQRRTKNAPYYVGIARLIDTFRATFKVSVLL